MQRNKQPSYLVLFFLCWLLYSTSYLGRLNFSAAMPIMLSNGMLTTSQAGLIPTLFFISYAGGQIINGILGDKLSPKFMPFLGIVISCLCNCSMPFMDNFIVMAIIWGINGYAQSMIWPSLMRIISCYFPDNSKIRAFMWLSSTTPAGTLMSYAVSAWSIDVFGFSAAFLLPSAIMLTTGLIYVIFFPKEILTIENNYNKSDSLVDMKKKSRAPLRKILFSPIVLLVLIPTFVQGIIKDGLTAWIPTYISENFHAEAVTAILVTMVLPVINLLGTYAVGIVQKKVKNELSLAAMFFLFTSISLSILLIFGTSSLIIALIMLGLSSASILAVNTVFINFLPINFSKVGRASFISGFLNATGYAGAAVSSYGIGVTVELFGWNTTILVFIILIVLAFLICFFNRKKNDL